MSLEISFQAQRRARIRASLPTEHPQALDEIAQMVAGLPDPAELSVEELAGSLGVAGKLVNQLEAWLTSVAAEADARGVAQTLCAGTTGTMVAAALNTNGPVGSGMVATGRALRDMPATAAAFADGRIGTRQVLALQHAAPQVAGFATCEDSLVEVASQVDAKELRRLLDVLISQSIPEGADIDHLAQHAKRGLSLTERPDGMWKIDGLLDGLAGNKLHDLLQPLMAKDGTDDTRTPRQRRADALDDVMSLARANRSPIGVSGLSVLIDLEDLPDGVRGALEDGTVLGPATFDLLSCSVALACVFGVKRPGGFVPLRLGRTARRANAHQWAALTARDRGCVRCGRPPRNCEAHHIVHWRHGGLTDVENMCLMCPRCHHDLHLGFFAVVMDEEGIPVVTTGRGPPGLAV